MKIPVPIQIPAIAEVESAELDSAVDDAAGATGIADSNNVAGPLVLSTLFSTVSGKVAGVAGSEGADEVSTTRLGCDADDVWTFEDW